MIKKFLWVLGAVLWLPNAWAFSLLGPVGDIGAQGPWQIPANGFNPISSVDDFSPLQFLDSLSTGPKNLGEEYRRNVPVLYYASDANFLDYFGSNGVAALDSAFATLNNAFTNENGTFLPNGVDSYSPGVAGFPLNSQTLNYQAQALSLRDLKSVTMAVMLEQLGLADSVRYIWVLHDRYTSFAGAVCGIYFPALGYFGVNPSGQVLNYEYLVVQRNFDTIASPLNQIQYSAYVNGELYTYVIIENCNDPGSTASADAVEVPTDAPQPQNPPVASGEGEAPLDQGFFYTGLTRDDVAGLRYLYSTNTVNYEPASPGSLLISSTSGGTNFGAPFVLYTSNYTSLFLSSQTNDPATLATLFPGLVVSSSITNFVGVFVPNIGFVTNPVIGAPAGTVEIDIVTNGFTPEVLTNYTDTFGNVIIVATNSFRTNTSARIMTVDIGPLGGAPAGTLRTNVTLTRVILTNVPSGAFYISTNPCGPNVILSTLLTNVVASTNLLIAFTNSQGFSTTESLITYFTNYIFVAEPIVCASGGTVGQANVAGLYQGMGKMQFVRANFDSLLGQFFSPITNTYTMVTITNNHAITQTFQRILTTPDFLFSAQDLVNGPGGTLTVEDRSRTINLAADPNDNPNVTGPGIINPSSTISYDKVGPVFVNSGPGGSYGMTGPNFGSSFIWGSFDGSTNDPIVYPNGTSLQNIANQVLIQISSIPSTLPDATNTYSYNASFSATGGQPPYTWSLGSGTQLPQNLTLSPTGVISGIVTNNAPGVYVFTVQLNDSANRVESLNYFITVH